MKNQDWNTKSDPIFDKFNKQTVGKLGTLEARYASTDFLRFDPERVHKLAEGFTNPQQMIDYKGENQKQIRAAGHYIMGHKIERPEWFSTDKLNQTKEEVLDEAKKLKGRFDDIDKKIKAKLWRHYGSDEIKTLLPNLSWKRNPKTDDERYDILNQYETAADCRNSCMENKNMMSQVSTDKGVKYPRTYALFQEKKSGHTAPRSKRGSYKQRDPLIQQWSKDGQLLGEFTWEQIVNDLGYKRTSITGALKGHNGQKTAKGYIWKYKTK